MSSASKVLETLLLVKRTLLRGQRWCYVIYLIYWEDNTPWGSMFTKYFICSFFISQPLKLGRILSIKMGNGLWAKVKSQAQFCVVQLRGGHLCSMEGWVSEDRFRQCCLEIHQILWERKINFCSYKTLRLGVVSAE